ncbi:MAG TPA: usg protein [Candidatus Paceibacterota bacterium]|nr:usg protein [Candidatus Paceibacterota bacterium]
MSNEFEQMMRGYGLTTAEILYRMPDHPSLLQTYLWQDYDLHPRFPKLRHFLEFWETSLDGKLFRVRVAHSRLIRPSEVRIIEGKFQMH